MRDFKEFALILLVIALVIAGVQWLLLRFTHWAVALAATGVISFVIASVYVQLKNATPNGGSSGPGFAEFVTPTLVVFAVLFIGFLLVCYFMQYQLPGTAYKFTFGAIALFAIIHFGYQEVKQATFYAGLFSICKVTIMDEADSVTKLEEIRFTNTSNGVYLPVIASNEDALSSMVRFADKISFITKSPTSDRMVRKEFPFDYSLCKETQHSGIIFWVKTSRILPMKIVLLPDEKVDLYIGGDFVEQYQLGDSDVLATD